MNAIRTAFFASHNIAFSALRVLRKSQYINLVGVMSQPDRPSGRGQNLQTNMITSWADQSSIPVFRAEGKPGTTAVNWLNSLGVELIFVMAFGHILPNLLLQQPSLGVFNFHTSLLPRYRGASPIQSAISNGDLTTGVTIMKIIPAIDEGGVLDQEVVCISQDDTTASLSNKLSSATIPLIERNIKDIALQNTISFPQNQLNASFTRKLQKIDGWINFSRPSKIILNRIRACNPWPGSFFKHRCQYVKIGGASIVNDSHNKEPGTVLGQTSNASHLQFALGAHT